jgi:toxin-antitoxin system PIN domain toxin
VSYTVDANILLYASDEISPVYAQARALVEQVAAGPEIAYLFWPTVMAYLRIATHPAVFARPLSIVEAKGNIDQLLARSHVRTTGESDRFWRAFGAVVDDALPSGNLVPDAHLVGLMLENDVRTILTRDRDLRRFPGIEVRDPFVRG